jgi:hypothetical protein
MGTNLSNITTYLKQPSEILPIEVSFAKLHVLPRGAKEIIEATVDVKRWKRKFPDDVETVSNFLYEEPKILLPNKTKIGIVIHGGEDGYDYQLSLLVTFDNNIKLEEEIFVRVREE